MIKQTRHYKAIVHHRTPLQEGFHTDIILARLDRASSSRRTKYKFRAHINFRGPRSILVPHRAPPGACDVLG